MINYDKTITGEEDGQGEVNGLMSYWKNLAVVLFGCLCLFVFDMCERGVQLQVASQFCKSRLNFLKFETESDYDSQI